MTLLGAQLFEQSDGALAHVAALVGKPRPDLLHGHIKAATVEGLEQIIERVNLEGSQRIVVVSGDEDDQRHLTCRDRAERGEAIHFGHLHVEEDERGPLFIDRRDRFTTVGAFADHLHVRVAREHTAYAPTRQRLVVHDQRAYGFRRTHPMATLC